MYADAAEYHRATTAAIARYNKSMNKMNKAVARENDHETRKRLQNELEVAAEKFRHTLQVCKKEKCRRINSVTVHNCCLQ